MEVKNQAVDQLLLNTASSAPASQNAKAGKDGDRPDFDTMVQKRTAEKDVPKSSGQTKPAAPKAADDKAPAQDAPLSDNQYAMAAAMMLQVQPDGPRMAQTQPELIAAENTLTVEIVPTGAVETPTETPEMQLTPDVPVAQAVEAAAAEVTAAPEETPAAADNTAQAPVEEKREAPVDAKGKAKGETKAEADDAPKMQPAEHRTEAAKENAPRNERPVRFERSVEQAENDEDAPLETAQPQTSAPVFERTESTMVKVAEAPREIPLEAEDGVEQLSEVIVNSASADRVEVQLTPENLGKLTVEITRGTDGTLNVVLHTETQRAANLLEKGADGLRQALAGSREQNVQIEVRASEESQRQFLNPDGQNDQNRQQQQQQQRNGRRDDGQNAQDFLQQLRLGLVDVQNNE